MNFDLHRDRSVYESFEGLVDKALSRMAKQLDCLIRSQDRAAFPDRTEPLRQWDLFTEIEGDTQSMNVVEIEAIDRIIDVLESRRGTVDLLE